MISTTSTESKPVHPLARFVTKEAIALLLNIEITQIKDIRCWANVILVVGKGLSKFVSYADLPPILGVEPPTHQDFIRWRKRWQKLKTKQAPEFWVKFYATKFGQSCSITELYQWGKLLGLVKLALSQPAVQALRSIYAEEKYSRFDVQTRNIPPVQNPNRVANSYPNQRAASLA